MSHFESPAMGVPQLNATGLAVAELLEERDRLVARVAALEASASREGMTPSEEFCFAAGCSHEREKAVVAKNTAEWRVDALRTEVNAAQAEAATWRSRAMSSAFEREDKQAEVAQLLVKLAQAKADSRERYLAGVTTGESMRAGLMAKIEELRTAIAKLRAVIASNPPCERCALAESDLAAVRADFDRLHEDYDRLYRQEEP